MAQWIEVRARYDKMMENGSVKKVTDLTSEAEREADKILRDPKVKRHAKAFVDACAESGVESVTMTACDGRTVQSATIEIPPKGNKFKPNDNG